MCPVCPSVLRFPLFSLSLHLPLPGLGAAWTSSSGPVSVASACLSCCCPSCFFMLYSHCCIMYTCILYIRSGVFVFVFCLSLSLFFLSCPSLLLFLYPAESQQDGSSCSRFLPVKRKSFRATVLSRGSGSV